MRRNIANLENLDETGPMGLLSRMSRYYAWAVRTALTATPFEREKAIRQTEDAGQALDAVRAAYAGRGEVSEA